MVWVTKTWNEDHWTGKRRKDWWCIMAIQHQTRACFDINSRGLKNKKRKYTRY